MSILGLGVDVVHISRIASLVARRGQQRFAQRILSVEELSDFKISTISPTRFLAVRYIIIIYYPVSGGIYILCSFSVKEAAFKALYPIAKPTWKELTYRSASNPPDTSKPHLIYKPLAPPESLRIGQILVSVSHDGEYVMTAVIVTSA